MIYFAFYPIVFVVFRLLARVLGRLQSSGEQNIPRTGPVIYCPNHLSDADPPTMFVTVPRRAWYLGKTELFGPSVVGWFFRHFRGVPIKRDSADRAALRRAEELLKRGEALVVFPEGRCAQDGRLQRLQPGAALLAARTGAALVPVGLRHTNEMLPYGATWPRFARHPVHVDFGPPIRPQDYAHLPRREAIDAMTRKLRQELTRLTVQTPRRDNASARQRPTPTRKRRPDATTPPRDDTPTPPRDNTPT